MSANAYLGAEALLPALDTGADVVLTGRVADPSLFVAPLAHRLGWELDDLPRIAAGTLVGHLLECVG
ncbi:acyclic terpene utilization AtuA family protein [Saccharopolyspora hattusasensis]|uniref:acyclic terpene utilization AtuA family protein n=1 Tax=Saccharopolyspora hattusasensis TaxID=1128679 RepID=UPI003D956F43